MRILAMLLITAIAAGAVRAADIETLNRDALAYQQAMMKHVGDLRIEQEGTFLAKGGQSSSMRVVMLRKGERWRTDGSIDMQTPDGKSSKLDATQLFDGQDLWSVVMGMKTKVPKGTSGGAAAPSFWMDPVAGSKIVGEETVGGRACWIVQGPPTPSGSPLQVEPVKSWIDKSCFVPVQSETKLSGKQIRTVFSDFRKVEGRYEIPYQSDVFSGGEKTMSVKIVKLETRTGLADDLFDPNKLQGAANTLDMDALMKQAEEMKKKMESTSGTKKN